jgi:cytochrome P450
MSAQTSEKEPAHATSGARRKIDVDPALLAVIESASAPARKPKAVTLPDDIPGWTSFLTGMREIVEFTRNGVARATQLRAQHGDIYRANVAGVHMVIVWDPDEIHRILRNEGDTWSTGSGWNMAMFDGLDARGGNVGTLLSLDFDEHRVARKLVQPAFTTSAIDGYLATADRRFTPEIRTWVNRGNVAFKAEMRRLLARVANEIFTGIQDPQQVGLVDRSLSDFWGALIALVRHPWLSPTFRRSKAGLQHLLETFLALVPERRKSGGEDLFSRMCAVEDRDGLDDEALVRVFITIMFGAFDTTSAGMTSMAYLLAKHPEWQERLREEARGVTAEKLDVAALKGMKQHEWAWKETLRLMPVNGYLPRMALREVTIGKWKLPPGALVMPMNGGVGRHPKHWKDPETFDPERFSPERAEDKAHPGIYNPFGAGAHACVGMQLANFEMKVFWHRMLSSCRLRLAPDYDARHTFTPMGTVSGDVRLALENL